MKRFADIGRAHMGRAALAVAGALSLAGCMVSFGDGDTPPNQDLVPPGAPSIERIAPEGPSNIPNPIVFGQAEAGARVRIFSTLDCSGAALVEGTAEAFATTGLQVPVARNADNKLFAQAVDAAGNASACSAQGTPYLHDDIPPAFAGELTAAPTSPTQITVTWKPATDGATAGDDIRYDLCVSPSPQTPDCKPFVPTHEAGPGTTMWNVGGLQENTGYTVVVRARDAAGNVTEHATRVTERTLHPRAQGLAAGMFHTCAVTPTQTVECWGWNFAGQLGAGVDAERSTRPVAVPGVSGALTLSAGAMHTCAVLGDRSVACWGDDGHGQLGGAKLATAQAAGAPVAELGRTISVAAGLAHTCALIEGGGVRCWGDNSMGQLGDGSVKSSRTPVTARGVEKAVALVSGDHHSCALLASGETQCWGANIAGELGVPGEGSRIPVRVPSLQRAVGLALGQTFTCARFDDGTARCFGQNTEGQLGDGNPGADVLSPVNVDGLTSVKALTAGWNHACAVVGQTTLHCWGRNADGQLGDGSTLNQSRPVVAQGMANIVAVSAGESHTCAMNEANEIRCAGRNDFGQLGDGTTRDRTALTPIAR